MDDMLVKSITFEQHLQELGEVFQVLQSHNIKLNLFKCVFSIQGRSSWVFLSAIVGLNLT